MRNRVLLLGLMLLLMYVSVSLPDSVLNNVPYLSGDNIRYFYYVFVIFFFGLLAIFLREATLKSR